MLEVLPDCLAGEGSNGVGGSHPSTKLYIVKDYRGAFWSSTRNKWTLCSMDIPRLCASFAEYGLEPRVLGFADVCQDLGPHWRDRMVVYQSAEDPDLNYRSYIEDVVMGLEAFGARVMPSFRHLRAHHNKVFGEILARAHCGDLAPRLATRCFGCLEEFEEAKTSAPFVLKSAVGAGSREVTLAAGPARAMRLARRVSRSKSWIEAAKELLKRHTRKGYVPYSLHRMKFLVQEYIPGLTSDYKVLCYGNRLYVLQRGVRPGDFRASGSGRYSWPEAPSRDLMDFAYALHDAFDAPCSSLDIADTNEGFRLLETQFVVFGPLTLEASRWHFELSGGAWRRVDGASDLEGVFAQCVAEFARRKGWLG